MNKVEFGKIGEIRVHDILIGSKHLNSKKQASLTHDIEWNGIRIDVKHTNNINDDCAIFTPKQGGKRHNGIVLVFTAERDGQEYFWVDKYRLNRTGDRKRLEDAISADKLPDAVLDEFSREVDLLENENDISSKSISVSGADWDSYDQDRKDFAERNGIPESKVSIAMILNVGMSYYRQRVGSTISEHRGEKK